MDLKNKTQLYAAYKRLISAVRTHGQNEGMEKDIQGKWKPKESRGSYSYIRQNWF